LYTYIETPKGESVVIAGATKISRDFKSFLESLEGMLRYLLNPKV